MYLSHPSYVVGFLVYFGMYFWGKKKSIESQFRTRSALLVLIGIGILLTLQEADSQPVPDNLPPRERAYVTSRLWDILKSLQVFCKKGNPYYNNLT